MALLCMGIYYLLFTTMLRLNIAGYNTPLSSLPLYLSFWGLYLFYLLSCGNNNTGFYYLIRSKSLWRHLLYKMRALLIDNAIYCFVFTVCIYFYWYFKIDVFQMKTLILFFLTLNFSVFLLAYLFTVVRLFYSQQIAFIVSLLMMILTAIPEISYFISVRLGLANNYYIKPFMLISKSYNQVTTLVDTVMVSIVWITMITIGFMAIKAVRTKVNVQ